MFWVMAEEHGKMAAGWQHYDERNKRFFFHNAVLNTTTWDYPAKKPAVVVKEGATSAATSVKASDQKDMEAKQEVRKEAFKKAAKAEDAKAQRSPNAEDIRKARRDNDGGQESRRYRNQQRPSTAMSGRCGGNPFGLGGGSS